MLSKYICRKMEKARPMREEMDGKVVYFPPESAPTCDVIPFDSTFPLFPNADSVNLQFDSSIKVNQLLITENTFLVEWQPAKKGS